MKLCYSSMIVHKRILMNSQEEQQEKNAPRQGRMRSATMGSIPQSAYHSFSPNHSKGSKIELID